MEWAKKNLRIKSTLVGTKKKFFVASINWIGKMLLKIR